MMMVARTPNEVYTRRLTPCKKKSFFVTIACEMSEGRIARAFCFFFWLEMPRRWVEDSCESKKNQDIQ